VNGRAITRVTCSLPWTWLVSCGKGISTWMYLGSADMIFMYVRELVCHARYRCWLVSKTVFDHSHLYMNLIGHTHKGFETLKSKHILSLMQVAHCWWCAQKAIITIQIKSHRIFNPSCVRVLMGLQLGISLADSINMRGGARGAIHLHTTTWEAYPPPPLGLTLNPSCAQCASTPTHCISSLYVWTPWMRCCCCYCTDQL
jgi:hypothetical protein